MWVNLLLVLMGLAQLGSSNSGHTQKSATVYQQLQAYKDSTKGSRSTLTTTSGAPVSEKDAGNTINSDLMFNPHLREEINAFTHQNIPSRLFSGKGAGARGYFKVTHDVTNITNALVFAPDKITSLAARLSVFFTEKGTPDSIQGPKGFSVKFYTEEGNFDFIGISTDTYFIKDPVYSPLHAFFRNPKTHVRDPNAMWDWITLRPESSSIVLQYMGEAGYFQSIGNTPSYAIHTYQVENDHQEISFVRFSLTPDAGIRYINTTYARYLAGIEPDYAIIGLYNAIAKGKFPSWTLGMQVIPQNDVIQVLFDIFDITLRWPYDKYPILPVGKLVLNQNPKNHFREVEQIAFNPGNVVRGIQGVDKMFSVRAWAYVDAQTYRLGPNYNKIYINCPLNKAMTYTRDGSPPVSDNMNDTPNYYPNDFNGPSPAKDTGTRTKRVQVYTKPEATNYEQSREWYRSLSKDAQERLAENLVESLKKTYPSIQQRVLELFNKIDVDLKNAVQDGLTKYAAYFNSTCTTTN